MQLLCCALLCCTPAGARWLPCTVVLTCQLLLTECWDMTRESARVSGMFWVVFVAVGLAPRFMPCQHCLALQSAVVVLSMLLTVHLYFLAHLLQASVSRLSP